MYIFQISPHPYDNDFDFLVCLDEATAREAMMDLAEKIWDETETGAKGEPYERTIKYKFFETQLVKEVCRFCQHHEFANDGEFCTHPDVIFGDHGLYIGRRMLEKFIPAWCPIEEAK